MFLRAGGFQVFDLFLEGFVHEGVLVLKAVQDTQDGRTVIVKAVITPPLQITDLHRDLREFIRVGVDLNGLQLLHANLRLEVEIKDGGKGKDLLFQAQKQLQRDV